jgi:hypothetical protein
MEGRAPAAVIVAVVQRGRDTGQQFGEPRLALDQRPRADVVTVEMEQVEDEEDQPRPRARG